MFNSLPITELFLAWMYLECALLDNANFIIYNILPTEWFDLDTNTHDNSHQCLWPFFVVVTNTKKQFKYKNHIINWICAAEIINVSKLFEKFLQLLTIAYQLLCEMIQNCISGETFWIYSIASSECICALSQILQQFIATTHTIQ